MSYYKYRNNYFIGIKSKIILLVMFCSILACQENNLKRSVRRIKRKNILIPKNPSKLGNVKKELKVVSYIDGNCPVCIDDLKLWADWIKKDSSNTHFYLFFHTIDTSCFDYFKKTYYELDYPLICDIEDSFRKKNSLNDYDKRLLTFLCDSNNNVILVGNPLHNDMLMKLYKRELSN